MDLTGRRILVTGASSGIGKATALLLSRLGARLVLSGRNIERLNATASLLEGSGHQINVFDFSDLSGIPAWMKQLVDTGGPFLGLAHCAGITDVMPLRYLKLGNAAAMMELNVTSALALTQAFRRKGSCEPDSSIVFISSVVGLAGKSGQAVYAATKGALIAMVRPLALEMAPERVRINCVAPGHVEDTGIARWVEEAMPETVPGIRARHPLGMGRALNVAHAIAFLLADTGSWITGTTLVVDGGALLS